MLERRARVPGEVARFLAAVEPALESRVSLKVEDLAVDRARSVEPSQHGAEGRAFVIPARLDVAQRRQTEHHPLASLGLEDVDGAFGQADFGVRRRFGQLALERGKITDDLAITADRVEIEKTTDMPVRFDKHEPAHHRATRLRQWPVEERHLALLHDARSPPPLQKSAPRKRDVA